MKTRFAKLSALCLLLLASAAVSAFAANITIYGTGQTNNGSGQADPNYQVSGPGVPLGPAYTTPAFGFWQTPPPGLYWDNPFSQFSGGPLGEYDYQTTFSLSGFNPTTAVLTGQTGSDDAGTIWLNGTMVGTMGSISTFAPFSITEGLNGAHFQSGINSLVFKVDNTLDQSPTGLMVDISGTADVVPEPGSLTLLGSGIVGIARLLRQRID